MEENQEELVELKEGYITSKDLAKWFGIKANTLSKNKQKKLQELKNYADFEVKKNKVYIKKVLKPYYSKAYDTVLNCIDSCWSQTGLDSCSRVSMQILEENHELKIKPSTIYSYTRSGRDLLYGKPFTTIGTIGSCVYVWCKRSLDENNQIHYDFLTEEEQEIKKKLITKYFGDATQKQLLMKGMVDAGQLTVEQAWYELMKITNMQDGNFLEFLKQLQATLGCQVVRGTYVTRQLSAFDMEE